MGNRERAEKALGSYANDLSDEELAEFGDDEDIDAHTWNVSVTSSNGDYHFEAKSKMQACERVWELCGMSKEIGFTKTGKKRRNLPWDAGLYTKLYYSNKTVNLNQWIITRATPSELDPLGEDLLVSENHC